MLVLNSPINRSFVQGVEDFRRHRHPGGLCNQHLLCGGLRDVPEQRAALRSLCTALPSLPVLCKLPGELDHCNIAFISHTLFFYCSQ